MKRLFAIVLLLAGATARAQSDVPQVTAHIQPDSVMIGDRFDLVGIRVYDPRETQLPDVGIVELKDAESGRKVWVDTSSRAVREHYAEKWQQRSAEIESTLKHNRIDTAMVSTEGDYVAELIKLFKQR